MYVLFVTCVTLQEALQEGFDQDFEDAVRENEQVMGNMRQQITMLDAAIRGG